jgi:curved DNA-binding protein
MEYRDYYDTLAVAKTATADEIKSSYRRLARKFHPDVSKEANAEDRFKEIGEAYEVLRDSEKRSAYDQLGPNWKAGQDFRAPPGWGGQHNFGGGRPGGPGGADPFSDFFSELFGGQGRRGPRPGGAGQRQQAPQPQVQTLQVTLEEAWAGTERSLRLTETLAGGAAKERTLKVRVPAGVTAGQRIRLSGQGGVSGSGRADLLLEIRLAAHAMFQVDGADITLELPLTPWEAALGATVGVPTLGGKVDLRIPPGSRHGAKMRLKGRGLGKDRTGNQYCVLKVVLPSADEPGMRELYETMAAQSEFNPRADWEN